jgi:quinol monooxygenase YgiN
MSIVSTLDVHDLTAEEYRAVVDELVVEHRPESGIYLHLTTPTAIRYRVVEIWDEQANFDRFVEHRRVPANQALGLERLTDINVTPLHNFFAPRLDELPGLVSSLPGAPTHR